MINGEEAMSAVVRVAALTAGQVYSLRVDVDTSQAQARLESIRELAERLDAERSLP